MNYHSKVDYGSWGDNYVATALSRSCYLQKFNYCQKIPAIYCNIYGPFCATLVRVLTLI